MPFVDLNESRDRRLQMLLNTAAQIQQQKLAQEELQIKKDQMDPGYQARQLSATLALVNPDAAVKLFNNVSLPSQSQAKVDQATAIPDYLGAGQNRVNSATALQPGALGFTGGSLKVGKNSINLGNPKAPELSDYDKANLGIHTDLTKQKLTDTQKKVAGAESGITSTKRLLNQFARSRKELEAFDPEIGKEGFSGWMSRRGGDLANYFDQLPETKALNVMAEPVAYRMAREMEGGRTTDQDRAVFSKRFANALRNPDSTNVRIAADAVIEYLDAGADENKVVGMLSDLQKSDVDVVRNISEKVFEDRPNLRIKSLGLSDEWEVVK